MADTTTETQLLWANIKDIAASPYFRNAPFNNIPKEFIDHYRSIPGFERLFGELDYRHCEHCRSAYGPAAYLVDLLRFVEKHITEPHRQALGQSDPSNGTIAPGLSLEARRPDLFELELSCENTNEQLPTIQIIIEVLERMLRRSDRPAVEQQLAEAVFPMLLPVHRPLNEIRAWLEQMNSSLLEVYQRLGTPTTNADTVSPVVREQLSLSPQDLDQLLTPRQGADLDEVYGYDGSMDLVEKLKSVNSFLDRTGLSRQELDELLFGDLDEHEIAAGIPASFFINNAGDGSGPLRIEESSASGATGLGDENLVNLSKKKLDRIYRFLKLARKLGWSFRELDQALRSLGESAGPERALVFDGVDSRLDAAVEQWQGFQGLTIEAWIKVEKAGENIVVWRGNSDGPYFQLTVDADQRLSFSYRGETQEAKDRLIEKKREAIQVDLDDLPANVDATGLAKAESTMLRYAEFKPVRSLRKLPLGRFVHVALCLNIRGTPDTARLYINGRLDAQVEVENLTALSNMGGGAVHVGGDADSAKFQGVIKELRIWSIDRHEQIAADRYKRLNGSEDELVHYWTLTENPWLGLADQSTAQSDLEHQHSPRRTPPSWVPQDLRLDPLPKDGIDWRLSRGALAFGGDKEPITLAEDLDAYSQRTIEVWFRVDGREPNRTQVLYEEGGGLEVINIDVDPPPGEQRQVRYGEVCGLNLVVVDGKLRLRAFSTLGEESEWPGVLFESERLEVHQWHHAAFVVDGTLGREAAFAAYLDGDAVDRVAHDATDADDANGPDDLFWICPRERALGGISRSTFLATGRANAANAADDAHVLNGEILDLRIWKKVRTADELWRDRFRTDLAPDDDLVVWFGETTGQKTLIHDGGNTIEPDPANLGSGKLEVGPRLSRSGQRPQIDAKTLQLLGEIRALQTQLDTPIDDLVPVWHHLSPHGHREGASAWDERFNPADSSRQRWDFYPTEAIWWNRSAGDDENRRTEHRLMASLGVSEDTLETLVDHVVGAQQTRIRIDGTTLSNLARIVLAASLLESDVPELLKISEHFKIGNLRSATAFTRLATRVDRLRKIDLSIDDLRAFKDDPAPPDASDVAWQTLVGGLLATLSAEAKDLPPVRESLAVALAALRGVSAPTAEQLATTMDLDLDPISFRASLVGAVAEILEIEPEAAAERIGDLDPTPYLEPLRGSLAGAIAERLDISPRIVDLLIGETDLAPDPELLRKWQPNSEADRELREIFDVALVQMRRINEVFTLAGLDAAESEALLRAPGRLRPGKLLKPNLKDLECLVAFHHLGTTLGKQRDEFLRLFVDGSELTDKKISQLGTWPLADVETLRSRDGSGGKPDAISDLTRIADILGYAAKLGIKPTALAEIADGADLGYDAFARQARTLRDLLRSRFDNKAWAKFSAPIRDRLSVQWRDALIARAMLELPRDKDVRRSPDGLSSYLLLDVQTGSAVNTSRLVRAIATVQLYVQRCIMGLESGVPPEAVPRDQWQWFKNYRVWEANRKVFLYPENYIEPELRDTKTPLFEGLEQELMQSVIGDASVTKAFTTYLNGFSELASLQIVGAYRYKDPQKEAFVAPDATESDPSDVLYLVGRTRAQPHALYQRSRDRELGWRPWEKIDLTIDSPYVTPVFAFNRLFLFWAETTELKKTEGKGDKAVEKEIYNARIKYSYQDLSHTWVQPQTYLELDEDIPAEEVLLPEWQRVYAQRSVRRKDDSSIANPAPDTPVGSKVLNIRPQDPPRIRVRSDLVRTDDLTVSFWIHLPKDSRRRFKTKSEKVSAMLLEYGYSGQPRGLSSNAPLHVECRLDIEEAKAERDREDALDVAHRALGRGATFAKKVRSEMVTIQNALKDQSSNKAFLVITGLSSSAVMDAEISTATTQLISTGIEGLISSARKLQTSSRNIAAAFRNATTAALKLLESGDSAKKADFDAVREFFEDHLENINSMSDDIAQLQTATNEQLELVKPFESKEATLIFSVGDHSLKTTIGYDKWQHVALVVDSKQLSSGVLGISRVGFGLVDANLKLLVASETEAHQQVDAISVSAGSGLGIFGSRPLIAVATEVESDIQVQMCHVRTWDHIRDTAALDNSRMAGLSDWESGLFQLPLDRHDLSIGTYPLTDSTLVIEGGEKSKSSKAEEKRISEIPERILLFYGNLKKTIRNNLDEQGFTLKAAIPSVQSDPPRPWTWDLNLALSKLHVARTHGLSLMEYGLNPITPEGTPHAVIKRFFSTEFLKLLGKVETGASNDSAMLKGLIKGYMDAFNPAERANHEDNVLLENLPHFESTLIDVNNQPGWYVLDIGDESFLVEGNGAGSELMTTEERTLLEFPGSIHQLEAQPVEFVVTADPAMAADSWPTTTEKPLQFHFQRLGSYAVHQLEQRLFALGIDGLLALESQQLKEPAFDRLSPQEGWIDPKQPEKIEFEGALGTYFWEIFFHIPFLIANRLNSEQQFEEAQRWYHYIFDPTTTEAGSGTKRYWRFRPFRNVTVESVREMLDNTEALKAYHEDPFDPHHIARLRYVAYQKAVVMKYIDNLLDWADQLFRRDTREAINEALAIYILAFDLLGPRPEQRPVKDIVEMGSYDDLRYQSENDVPEFLVALEAETGASGGTSDVQLMSQFCLTENQDFVAYWDRVEDRLYKIRHSLNFEGAFRSLALFEPPIDPRQLVRAAAGGGAAGGLSSLRVEIPPYRFSAMLERARNTVATVTNFGSLLLAALEKRDAEQLAQMQTAHERNILELTTQVLKDQIEEARATRDSLKESKKSAETREKHYADLIDNGLSELEITQTVLVATASGMKVGAMISHAIAAGLAQAPEFSVGGAGIASPVAITSVGGSKWSKFATMAASIFELTSEILSSSAQITGTLGSYERREEEWELSQKTSEIEIEQLEKQIESADARVRVSERELDIHRKRQEQAQEIEEFHRRKFTNKDLYQWMLARISGLYFQAYKLAFDLSKRAERALQFELATSDQFLDFPAWDGMKKGLLAGEALTLDLHRMEKAYLLRNVRRQEIKRTISLSAIDPLALAALKANGICSFSLDEKLFAVDFPGHYCRQIKSLALTIPAVVSPYEGVKATLRQEKSRILLEPKEKAAAELFDPQVPDENLDESIAINWQANQQVAISEGTNDSGCFELNFNDERFLPFEGTGVDSKWILEMPKASNPIDFDSITDVIIHVNYTARVGGNEFKDSIKDQLKDFEGLHVIDLAHDFASEWHRFVNSDAPEPKMEFPLAPNGLHPGLKPSVKLMAGSLVPEFAGNARLERRLEFTLTPAAPSIEILPGSELPVGSFNANGMRIDRGENWILTSSTPLEEIDNLILIVRYSGQLDWE